MLDSEQRTQNLYAKLIELRDQQRARKRNAAVVIKGKALPWETNPHGMMKWYTHPLLTDTAYAALTFYVQQLGPGEKSGRLKCQGGVLFFVVDGTGHTLVNDKTLNWKKNDLIMLPLLQDGVIFQHFNDDSEQPSLLLACEANQAHSLGVDKGCGFEQLETSSTTRPK